MCRGRRGIGETHLPTVDFKVDISKECPETSDTVQREVVDHKRVVHSVRIRILADSIKEYSTVRSNLKL